MKQYNGIWGGPLSEELAEIGRNAFVNTFTPGPWVWGEWDILPEDREAQRRGEPHWTLREPHVCTDLCQGPIGRKAMEPERIVWSEGYETEGTNASEFDKALIAAAPDLYQLLLEAYESREGWDSEWMEHTKAALCRATTTIIEN